MPVIYLLVLICSVVLNRLPHARSEPYLLRVGLISLARYLLLGSVNLIQIESGTMPWLQMFAVLIYYWSCLDYATNPRL